MEHYTQNSTAITYGVVRNVASRVNYIIRDLNNTFMIMHVITIDIIDF